MSRLLGTMRDVLRQAIRQEESPTIDPIWGEWLGVVTNTKELDEEGNEVKHFRIQCQVPAKFYDQVLPWAWPKPTIMARGGGLVGGLPLPGDLVLITFLQGDRRMPMWSYGPWGSQADDPKNGIDLSSLISDEDTLAGVESDAPTQEPSTENPKTINREPKHAVGEPDIEDQGWKGSENIPRSSFQGEYGKVWVWRTPGGSSIEMDDTTGNERVQIHHVTGAHYEILPDGTIEDVATGNRIQFTNGNLSAKVIGNMDVEVQGDFTQTVHGFSSTLSNAGPGEKAKITRGLTSSDPNDPEFKMQVVSIGDTMYQGRSAKFKLKGGMWQELGGSFVQDIQGSVKQQVGGSYTSQIIGDMIETVMKTVTQNISCIIGPQAADPLTLAYWRNTLGGLDVETLADPTGKIIGGHHVKGWKPPFQRMWSGSGFPKELALLPSPLAPGMGSQLHLDGTGVTTTLSSMLNLLLTSLATMILTSPKIFLGGPAAFEPLILGLAFQSIWATHTHNTPSGVSGFPNTPVLAPAFSKVVTSL